MSKELKPVTTDGNVFTGLFDQFRAVIMTPNDFFENMPLEGGLQGPAIFIAAVAVIAGLGVTVATMKPLQGVLEVVVRVVLAFISAGYLMVLSKGFGGTGSYEGTFRAFAYAAAPSVISWVPLLNLIALVYGIFLMRLGLERAQGLTTQRAVIVIAIWVVTMVGLMAIVAALSMMAIVRPHPDQAGLTSP